MSDIRIGIEMAFESTRESSDEEFEAFLDEVQTQLDAIGREVQLAARIRDREADFAISVEEPSFEIAAAGFLVDLRTALHAAGCVTANWPQFIAKERHVRELEDA